MSYSEKIYPEIPLALPTAEEAQQEHEGQTYRLKKIDEIEKFLRKEVADRDALSTRCKRCATAMTISDGSVIAAITALEIGSVVTLTTGIVKPLSIALATAGLVLGLSSDIVHKTQKVFDSKSKKHEKIKILAESKLDSISGIFSKAIEDAIISHEEYQFILKEVEHYRTLKEQIRTKSKRVVDTITANQREVILAEGREQRKQHLLRQIANTSVTPPANAT